jgi:integrase
MKYEKRTNKDGSSYYSFVTSDRKRLTREQIRDRFGKDILTEEEAAECVKLLDTKYEADKAKVAKRLAWEQKFYNFKALLDQYMVKQKKKAPNSWQNNEFYLKYYVLHYFLQVAKLNNIELWFDHYDSFRDWLETAKTVKSNRPIAAHSRNHAIKSLNTFMDHLYQANILSTYKKCEMFPEHMLNRRDVDDVVLEHEMETIYAKLIDLSYIEEAVYFRYLYFSGMRFNEGLCISLGDLYQGEIENEFMRKKLNAYDIEYFGYIVSDGQLDFVKDGHVKRAPFKGQKEIAEKYNRIVPITDKTLWNELVDIASTKFEKLSKKDNRRDALLFDTINDATATRRLQEAFESAKLKWRPWHCLRHSRATWLIGQTGDAMLARVCLGHMSPKTIEKYNHVYQAITRAAKSEKLTGGQFGLKKV